MRIAFVGKGGSGKSTLAAAFTSYLSKDTEKPVLIFDADINIHAPKLLGFDPLPQENHLSHPESVRTIKKWLIGANSITDLGMFKKTTPPTRKSNLLRISDGLTQTPLANLGVHRDNLSIFAVGTYKEEHIGASCYHNNLAIFESILNHTDDKNAYVVADMVAGVDAFAGTLHAQFDLTCLIVEPTKRSIAVYDLYTTLAEAAGTLGNLIVIGNKVRNQVDREFISKHVRPGALLGYFEDDFHIRQIDQTEEPIQPENLNENNRRLLEALKTCLESLPDLRNERLKKLWRLHEKYIDQPHLRGTGNLLGQIDSEFRFN